MRVEKPWGWEERFALTERYCGKVLFIKKGGRLSLQYHEKKEESLYLLWGEVQLTREHSGGVMTVTRHKAGWGVHIPAGTVHRIEAVEDSVVFEVSTPEVDDVVRLEDDYGRVGT